ncbi:MAG: M23 family metallopeptidase [Spirochaetaceae bacterium]|nr:M23 family metallopeptidase [Spirochaetaceae bacterium]
MSLNKHRFIFFIFLIIVFPVYADNSIYINYPKITVLNNSDIFFRQISSDITLSYRNNFRGRVPLSIYRYTPRRGETLFSIASRLNIPYESISTLNRMSSINEFNAERELLIPNQPVLFIPERPSSDIEYILTSRNVQGNNEFFINRVDGSREKFTYIKNERFNGTERAFFLSTFFRFPIEKGRITSRYGFRISPITGERHFHSGIDIAAPTGTPVFAAGRGVVVANGYNAVLGNYIIIKHPGSLYTVYGHLKQSFVVLNKQINSGTIIGEVGSTGLSTGPHLHFEVRSGGRTENPLNLFNRNQ